MIGNEEEAFEFDIDEFAKFICICCFVHESRGHTSIYDGLFKIHLDGISHCDPIKMKRISK